MAWAAKYFSEKELACQCGCNEAPIDEEFLFKLDALREAYGKPIIISSGYRCSNHPIEAKKSKPGSHASGKAADIAVSHEDAYNVLVIAIGLGFKRIGVQQKGSGRFIHLDTATAEEGFATPSIWSY